MPKVKKPDISAIVYKHSRTLRFPSHSKGTPEDWASFAGNCTALLLENASLCTALGWDPGAKVEPEDAGVGLLTQHEKAMYTAYRKQNKKPSADWRRLKADITGGNAHRKRWEKFVYPLSVMYGERLSAENAKAWAEKNNEYMPLLVAVRKVEQAKRDGRAIKASSKWRVLFNELVACRKIMSEIGTQRVSSSVEMKNLHRSFNEKEKELVKKLAKYENAVPGDKHDAVKFFETREAAYSKLTKIRTSRMTEGAGVRRQNIELTTLEANLRLRIMGLEERLEKEARSEKEARGSSNGASSSRSSRK